MHITSNTALAKEYGFTDCFTTMLYLCKLCQLLCPQVNKVYFKDVDKATCHASLHFRQRQFIKNVPEITEKRNFEQCFSDEFKPEEAKISPIIGSVDQDAVHDIARYN